MQKNNRRTRTKTATYRLTVCAMLCAVAVGIMGVGMLIEVMDMTMAVLASLVFLPILLTYGNKYALLCWAVSGTLAVILMPQSAAPWLFLCLIGYYPALKFRIDRLARLLRIVCKTLLVTVSVVIYLVAYWVVFTGCSGSVSQIFIGGLAGEGAGRWMAIAVVVLSYVVFFAFDLLIARVTVIYRYRWEARVRRWLK